MWGIVIVILLIIVFTLANPSQCESFEGQPTKTPITVYNSLYYIGDYVENKFGEPIIIARIQIGEIYPIYRSIRADGPIAISFKYNNTTTPLHVYRNGTNPDLLKVYRSMLTSSSKTDPVDIIVEGLDSIEYERVSNTISNRFDKQIATQADFFGNISRT